MPLAAPDIDFLRSFVAKQSGNVIRAGQGDLIETQLAPVVRDNGLTSIDQLVCKLRSPHSPLLASQVAQAVTINETSFFRDGHPFSVLRDLIIPNLIKLKGSQGIRIWCAASSTGQEPLSIAMLVREFFPQLTNLRIIATDLSEEVLAAARKGTYSQLEVNRGLPVKDLVRFFHRQGNKWQAKQELLDLIEYRQMNLTDRWVGMSSYDIVLIRNVLIYFEKAAKVEILKKVKQVLAPHGYLFMGSAETIIGLGIPFRREGNDGSIYYRHSS